MTFSLDKCAILLISNGKYTTTSICPETPKLDNKDNKGYHYLGVKEGVDFHMKEGGRGLTGVEDTHNCKCTTLLKYVLNSTNPLTQMVQNTPTPTQKFLLKFALSPNFTSPELTDDNHHKCLSKKPLHG
eukprot:11325492-Ditylum_brightwellii.AAC.1